MKKVSHSLRERRVPLRKPKVGYTLAWKCSCGTDFGGTKDGTSRTKARELHRKHKTVVTLLQEIADGVEQQAPNIEIPEVDLRDWLDPEVPLCGNPHHPDGAWHPSTPLPFRGPWWSRKGRRAQRRFERNIKQWACGCDAKETK